MPPKVTTSSRKPASTTTGGRAKAAPRTQLKASASVRAGGKVSAPTAAKAAAKAAPKTSKAKAQAQVDDSGQDLALRALALALDKKALEPVLLDVRELCSYCNFQLVLSGRSERQVDAITDGIRMGLRDVTPSVRPLGSEGGRTSQWSLIDYGDVIIHVFNHAVREHYDLEGLWSDAPRVEIDVPADARVAATDAY